MLLAAFLEAAGTHFTSSIGWGGRCTGRGGWKRNAAEDGREGSMIFGDAHTLALIPPSKEKAQEQSMQRREACRTCVRARTHRHAYNKPHAP